MKKRCIAWLIACTLLFTASAPAAAERLTVKAAEDDLIASFDFDDTDTGLKGGGAVATVHGTAVFSRSYGGAGNAISMNRSNWLSVTKENGTPLLAGLEEITVSYDSRAVNYGQGWAFFAAPNTNRQTYQNEHYLGVMDMGYGKLVTVERFNNNGSRPGNSLTADSTAEWKHVDIVVTETTTTLYIDGEERGSSTSTYKLSDIVGASGGILQLGKANWLDEGEYYGGLMDNFKIYGRAKSAAELAISDSDADVVARAKENLEISDMDDIRGNIYLPDEVKGASVSWSSSDPTVITDVFQNGKAAGVVTRGSSDKKVTLTAAITKGSVTSTKEFEVTVVKAPEPVSEDDYAGYLFGSFTGAEGNPMDEQIYFAASEDGYNYKDLNNCEPVLISQIGEMGVRDPYIMRSAEGDKFYLLATDLSIYYRGGWGNAAATTTGSRNLIIWESTDLVNWSEPRAVPVGTLDAGCAWAPEAIYNEATGEYVVYFAQSHIINGKEDKALRIFAAKTRDFVNFSDAEEYIYRSDTQSIIDTTMMKADDGYYYRASGDGQITLERSTDIFGSWSVVTTLNNLGLGGNMTGGKLEGPELFRFNKRDWINGRPTYGLYTDQYADGLGYLPVITTDLNDASNSRNSWQKLTSDRYNFDILKKRHGTILNLTSAEYARVVAGYSEQVVKQVDPADGVLADFTFDDDNTGFTGGAAKAVKNGNISLVDHDGGKAVYLNGSSFLNITGKNGENLLSGHEELAISYDYKPDNMDSNNWILYAAPNESTQTYRSERYIGLFANNGVTTAERFRNSGSRPQSPSADTGSDWAHVDVVYSKDGTAIYVNGYLEDTVSSSYSLIDILGGHGILYIGKANWGDGEYARGWIDNLKIVAGVVTPTPRPTPTPTAKPKDTATPKPTDIPTASPDPDAAADPNETPDPNGSGDSNATPDPSGNVEPDATANPNTSAGSTATPDPQAGYDGKQGGGIQAESVRLNVKANIKVGLKESVKLTAIVYPENASQAVTWSSSNSSVVSVSDTGKIKAKKTGKAVITATTANGKNAGVIVTVKKAPKKITAKVKSKTLKKGRTFKIKVKFPKKTASYKLTYRSGKKAVVTVSKTGKVKAKKKGTALVTIKTFNKKKATIKIVVE